MPPAKAGYHWDWDDAGNIVQVPNGTYTITASQIEAELRAYAASVGGWKHVRYIPENGSLSFIG